MYNRPGRDVSRETVRRHLTGSLSAAHAVAWLVSLLLGVFFLAAGINKFGSSGVVFRYLEYNSGFSWVHPAVQRMTGVVEMIAGVLLFTKKTRLAGAGIAASIMLAALSLHLSPWLGIAIPTDLTEGAATPWTAEDFAASTSSMTFGLAVAALAVSLGLLFHDLRARRGAALA